MGADHILSNWKLIDTLKLQKRTRKHYSDRQNQNISLKSKILILNSEPDKPKLC